MPEFSKSMDVQQGFNLKRDSKTPVGYITSLKIGETVLQPDLEYQSPIDMGTARQAIAILSDMSWDTGATDAVFLSGQLSAANKEVINQFLLASTEDITAQVCFSIFEYDNAARKYYSSAHSRNIALRGTLEKNGDELNLSVANDASTEMQSPENYAFRIGVRPTRVAQQIYLATSNNREVAKSWGLLAS